MQLAYQCHRFPLLALMYVSSLCAQSTMDPSVISERTRIWLSDKSGIDINLVHVHSPDPRLKFPICEEKMHFELPFSHTRTVLAKCSKPKWQTYLQAQISTSKLPTDTSSNVSNRSYTNNSHLSSKVLVLVRTQSRGNILTADDVEERMIPTKDFDPTMLTDFQSIEFMEAQRDLVPGVPLRTTDLRAARMIKQGQDVLLTIGDDTKGFKVSVRVEALQDAKLGDRVQLKNRESNKTITGIVTGPNTAKGL